MSSFGTTRNVAPSLLAGILLAGCGGGSTPDGSNATGASEGASDTAAGATSRYAIAPIPDGTKLTLQLKASSSAARSTADSDPLGARSDFRIARAGDVVCTMLATRPQGVGPDGPTPEQQAVIDAGEAATNAFATVGEPAEGSTQEARNAAAASTLEAAMQRVQAVYLEPNWQRVVPDFDRNTDEGACAGTITVDDQEVYRYGFDGGDMGEGVETRKGTSATGKPMVPSVLWYDLRNGRMVYPLQLHDISGTVPTVHEGARAKSHDWNERFTFNATWAAKAGEITRLERGDVRSVLGRWSFATPIDPAKHHGFAGKVEVEVAVTER